MGLAGWGGGSFEPYIETPIYTPYFNDLIGVGDFHVHSQLEEEIKNRGHWWLLFVMSSSATLIHPPVTPPQS